MGLLVIALSLLAALQLAALVSSRSRADALVQLGLIWTALVVGAMLLAGALGRLSTVPLLAIVGVALVASAAVARRNPLSQLRTGLGALADLWRLLRSDAWLLAAAAFVAAAYAYVFFIGVVFPPVSGDAMTYHLPLAVSFLQQGDLAVPELPSFGKGSLWAWYPANGSLLFALSVLVAGSDRFVDLVQWPYALLGGAAVFALSRRLGHGRRTSAWAALVYAAIPLVINQAKTSMIDVLVSFLVLAAVLAVASFERGRALEAGTLLGIACGLALGAKPAAPVHVALVALLAVAYVVVRRGPGSRLDLRSSAAVGSLSLAGIALLGGTWYVRNALLTGDPFYPASVIAPPIVDRLASTRTGAWLMFRDIKGGPEVTPGDSYSLAAGLGMPVICVVVPGVALALYDAVAARRGRRAVLAGTAVAGMTIWWLVNPFAVIGFGRYALPWIAVAAALAVGALAGARGGRTLAGPLLAATVVFTTALSLPPVGTLSDHDPLLAGLAEWRRTGDPPDPWRHRGPLTLFGYGEAWGWLDEHAREDRLAVVNHPFTYPLYGSRWPANTILVTHADSQEAWHEEVERLGVRYVVARTRVPMVAQSLIRIDTPLGPALRVAQISGSQFLEEAAVVHRAALAFGQPEIAAIAVTYRTDSSLGGEWTPVRHGTVWLALNELRLLLPLERHEWRDPEDPRGATRTERFSFPPGLRVGEIGVVVTERPFERMHLATSVDLFDVTLTARDGREASLSLDPADWGSMLLTPQEAWMLNRPDRFELVHESGPTDVKGYVQDSIYAMASRVRVYEVRAGDDAGAGE